MLYLDESSNEHEIELGIGEEFELRLPENATTGFRWQFASNGEPACVLESNFFEPADSTRTPGRGGTRSWRFQAAQEGLGTIELVYRRAFEPQALPARHFSLRVHIHA